MKILSYAWTVIQNLITLFFINLIYSNIYSTESIITISILILIYLTVIFGFASAAWMHIERNLVDYTRFKEMKRMLGTEISEEDEEYEEELE